MSSSAVGPVIRELIRDTFRQSLSTRIFWLMLAVSVLTAGVCLTVRVAEVADPASGTTRVDLLDGALTFDVTNPRAHPIRTLQLQLAGWVADAGGLLLALIWTAGFLPTFLQPNCVTVLLAKPTPRWSLLAGKFIGVLLFIALQTTVFITLTWLALALRTRVWDPRYFWCIPLLILHFAVFYSFSLMLAVATRSTVACAFGSIAFWLLCVAVNFGRHAKLLHSDLSGVQPGFGHTLEFVYWLLPKPLDFHFLLKELLEAENLFGRILDVTALARQGVWHPGASVTASLLFGLAMLLVASYDFQRTDY